MARVVNFMYFLGLFFCLKFSLKNYASLGSFYNFLKLHDTSF